MTLAYGWHTWVGWLLIGISIVAVGVLLAVAFAHHHHHHHE
jgi:hypothetical protein